MNKRPIVAIDGPAGAGKSTVTKRVADQLGYTQVDTGALYRSVAWLCNNRGVPLDSEVRVSEVARELAAPGALRMFAEADITKTYVHGQDVTSQIRSREAALGASLVSQIPQVRSALLEIQRELGKDGGVVLEGRDIGSVVFPHADAKFYLTASSEVRARRRQAELAVKGDAPDLDEIIAEVEERDRRDTARPIAPLVRAPDAIVVDSSQLDIDAVVELIVGRVRALEVS
jgi:cytidylate kinase